ncbi:MAG TPA: hypothetical protein VHD83_21005 [Puia sp.]|nr:hypothetical protein [Puia sp.]
MRYLRHLLLIIPLSFGHLAGRCQRAYPIEINSLMAKITIPKTSADCYQAATKTTDPNNDAISIKDNGAGFQTLQDQFDKITRAAMADMGAYTPMVSSGTALVNAKSGASTGCNRK